MTHKNKKRVLLSIITFLSLIFAISLSLFFYQKAYAGKIYKNVSFDSINLSGKTRVQAKSLIENYSTALLENKINVDSGDKTFTSTFFDAGLFVDSSEIANSAINFGRNQSFFKSIYFSAKTIFTKNKISLSAETNQDQFSAFKDRATVALNIPATDASLKISAGQVVVNTAENGLTVDSSGLDQLLKEKFLAKNDQSQILMPTAPLTPALLATDLVEAKTQAENYLSHQIQITLNNQNYSVDRNTIGSWIVFGKSGTSYSATISNSSIKNYVYSLAAKNDTPVIDNKISAVDNSVIQQGRQGIYTDQNDAINKITAALAASTLTATIALVQNPKDPTTITVFPNEGIVPGRFPGKYIDIDLTNQLLTAFEGTNQIGQYQISSGKASTPTPTGLRTILDKSPRAWSAPHGLWMPWWNGLGGGYGIHELPEWPNGYKEGEGHLGTPVSHGCIRLGVGPAEFIYNWSEIGDPVYIHK
ncbi:MAG: L,D-transpeptidase family protein [Candidatus Berkelbacteria bacterium]|nr:L,D-transpeptidase family protein [Candidatus Berkelbacteria bacterium]